MVNWLQVSIMHVQAGSGPPRAVYFNGSGATGSCKRPFLEALTSTTAFIFDVGPESSVGLANGAAPAWPFGRRRRLQSACGPSRCGGGAGLCGQR